MEQVIQIQYLDDSIPRLEYIGGKSDWIDLRAAETVSLKKGEFRLIHLGVAMKLPAGYEAHIAPRSSSYCGKEDWWKFPAYATEDVVIDKGSRIAQFRIMENQPKIHFEESTLEDKNRGGFGSTGIK